MRIVVVGGVAGGMSAAVRLRRLQEGAEIIVLEAGPEVSFANCGLPYFVSGEITDPGALLVQTPASLKASLNLDVRVNSAVTALDPAARTVRVNGPDADYELTYDVLVLSPGAEAFRPDVPGIDSPRVTTLRTVSDAHALHDAAAGASSAVVIGAGFIGLEAAEALAMRGVKTTVVEFADHVLPPLDTESAYYVAQELAELGMDVRTSTAVTAIEEPGAGGPADVVLSDGSRVKADVVVLAAGVRPRTSIWEDAGVECERGAIVVDEHGRTNLEGVWAVGDAVVSTDLVTGARRPVALAGPANRAGRLVADAISGNLSHPIPAAAGTAIVRVGKLTAAMTGANERALEGIAHHTISLHPADHAGYFPGATQMHMRLHFAEDGKVLGAQIVGRGGVDKRIDVLATAIKAGMTVADLIDLDLAYSPPYGSAKDPVNMAGMMASNVLDRTMDVWHTADLARLRQTHLILDVRSRAEYEGEGHIDGALNIPHLEIRDRMDEVRASAAGRPIAVHCKSGMRSYLAHRQLVQAGNTCVNHSGGMITMLAELGDSADGVVK
ncbi:pyridine nucleotide-disulfide oxidoreductase [Trueperella bernardiae]|uniref:FAD-dependent oxidoreductase n=1 Tax=Trueperella bernardiae TaxID=59561 RepID=UPI000C7BB1AD|nr:FAD-dependent oxidoreductase [Trueperella bernardiae]PKZ89236.1 pyridine nucleotide-disulfide oxidoreductase [Trueperella bernardiae]